MLSAPVRHKSRSVGGGGDGCPGAALDRCARACGVTFVAWRRLRCVLPRRLADPQSRDPGDGKQENSSQRQGTGVEGGPLRVRAPGRHAQGVLGAGNRGGGRLSVSIGTNRAGRVQGDERMHGSPCRRRPNGGHSEDQGWRRLRRDRQGRGGTQKSTGDRGQDTAGPTVLQKRARHDRSTRTGSQTTARTAFRAYPGVRLASQRNNARPARYCLGKKGGAA